MNVSSRVFLLAPAILLAVAISPAAAQSLNQGFSVTRPVTQVPGGPTIPPGTTVSHFQGGGFGGVLPFAALSRGGGFGYGFGLGAYAPRFSLRDFRVIGPNRDLPYYAQFPPVYYSGPVARPYGISPYAAPPGIMPVEMIAAPVCSGVMDNPYFQGDDDAEKSDEAGGDAPDAGAPADETSGRSASRVISNPFYQREAAPASPRLAGRNAR